MAFLVEDDYKAQIKADLLDKIVDADDNIRVAAENSAIGQAKSMLRVRYDVNAIFAATGDNRNTELVMYLVDMVLYHLHSRINPGQVPANRDKRYTDALDWLKNVGKGDWDPGFTLVGDEDGDGDDDNAVIQAGSQTPRDPYY